MRKFFCDKCGKEMPQDRRNVLTYSFNSFFKTSGKLATYQSASKNLDICDDCLKEFQVLGKDEED